MGTTRCKKHEDDYQRLFYTYTQVESEKPGEEDTKKLMENYYWKQGSGRTLVRINYT